MIVQGREASDVIANLGASLARAALQAALLGEGPLAGILGWGGDGGLIGMAIGALPGFAGGGGTGGSDPSKIAGVVHELEYVFDARSTAAIGVGNLDALRRGALRGYREGGFVQAGAPVAALFGAGVVPAAAAAAPREMAAHFTINVQGTGNAEIAAAVEAAIGRAVDNFSRQELPIRIAEVSADSRKIR